MSDDYERSVWERHYDVLKAKLGALELDNCDLRGRAAAANERLEREKRRADGLEGALTQLDRQRWTCPDCAFSFDALHTTEATGEYDCPLCMVERLRKTLAPLVAIADQLDERGDPDETILHAWHFKPGASAALTVGDCRRAREAMGPKS